MLKAQIRQVTQLWLDPDPSVDIADALARLNAGNRARDDMLDGLISVEDYLDVLSDLGLELDQFLENLDEDLGGIIATNSSPT